MNVYPHIVVSPTMIGPPEPLENTARHRAPPCSVCGTKYDIGGIVSTTPLSM
jgi:hypothetical protein